MVQNRGDPTRHTVAVVRSYEEAREVAGRLERVGVPPSEVHIAQPVDEYTERRAEAQAELNDGMIGGPSFITTKEGFRGFTLVSLIAVLFSLVVSFPLALVDVGWSYWGRFIVIAGALVVMSMSVALVLGTALGTKDEFERSAVDRGVVVHVDREPAFVRTVLEQADAIRVNEITPGGAPTATVYTETQETDDNLGARLGDTVEHIRHETKKFSSH